MFNLSLCNAATIRCSQLKFGHMHLCGMDYKYSSQQCCKCNSFGCTAAIRCGNACHGPHSDSLYSGSEHSQFNTPRLVKREAGFPNPRRALIGSNQLWRVNDSPYYREFKTFHSRKHIWKYCLRNIVYLSRGRWVKSPWLFLVFFVQVFASLWRSRRTAAPPCGNSRRKSRKILRFKRRSLPFVKK